MPSSPSPRPRPSPELPAAVTGSFTWAARRLDAAMRRAVESALHDDAPGVPLRGYWLLETIGASAAWAQRELGEALGVDRSDMVRLLDRLEDGGFIERVRDDRDRRRRLIRLTAAGERVRRRIRARVAAAEERVLAAADPALGAALRRAAAHAGGADPAGGPR
ncbi:MarR family transcriptional regulator [Corynebacterium sphenisci]|uniref:MarR family transcriptional regulator n=1 Tax=Corynebacterium sphenisci TaxID=191493 RepID=UPI0026DF40AA|nr:MarR family transcriptional regulator [Corynebacterium sphenisci]MDO5731473.1 MarR family transcriptional regulator [Corynebacterium sphenisci]